MQGRTVVCIGSGPSLTAADCELVRASGLPTIAINNAWESARFAEIIFGGDYAWWLNNPQALEAPAQKWTSSASARDKYGLLYFKPTGPDWHGGLRVIQLAEHLGAAKGILLGYDCTVRRGTHFHGKHLKTSNPTEGVCMGWRKQLHAYAKQVRIPVVNCSRHTVLKAFPLSTLEAELCLEHSPGAVRPKMNSSCESS